MLYHFIIDHRDLIVARAQERANQRMAPASSELEARQAIPVFLMQLADALAPIASVGPGAAGAGRTIGDNAAAHGQDLQRLGFSVAQVVHGYGDICQVVTSLAAEERASISPEDFQVFNSCLDDAIAGAVTAFSRQREHEIADAGTERLGVLAHELRNLVNTAVLSFDVIKKGMVGVSGSTAGVHARSLSGLRSIVEQSLAQVRLEADSPMIERVSVAEFIEEIEIGALMLAEGHGVRLSVSSEGGGAWIDIDRHLLASAVSNLLHNAFKFTRSQGSVSLVTRLTPERVLFDIRDQCGGLPAGQAEAMFLPFTRSSADRSGLGLGLSIALQAVRANRGDIHVRDIPGEGCVFTIDLPRQGPSPVSSTPQA